MTWAEKRKIAFRNGIKGGIPIGLAYLAVGISIGIACRNAGVNAFQSMLLSLFNLASAGEYADLTVIAADAAYAEIILITVVANARYLLMSCALSQRLSVKLPFVWRFLIGYGITDEIFAISVIQPGYLNPYFSLGAVLIAAPLWAIGTMIGVVIGNILPPVLLAAFSMALYGMFISIVILPSRKEKAVLICVIAGFACSYVLSVLPWTSGLSEGTRTIILTVLIGVVISLIFPYDSEAEDAALAEEIARSEAVDTAVKAAEAQNPDLVLNGKGGGRK